MHGIVEGSSTRASRSAPSLIDKRHVTPRMARLGGLSFLACLLGLTIFVSARISVDPVSQHFVDETGCVRVFHGVNVVYKVPRAVPTYLRFVVVVTAPRWGCACLPGGSVLPPAGWV
jgi:hypothetical protein